MTKTWDVDERAGAGLCGIEPVRAGFPGCEHSGRPADAVFPRHALHRLPVFRKAVALDRIAGMLRPRGVLRLRDLVHDFRRSEAGPVPERWMDGAAGDPALGCTGADLAEQVRTGSSTFRRLLEPMITAAGFRIADVRFEGAVYGTYTCVRR